MRKQSHSSTSHWNTLNLVLKNMRNCQSKLMPKILGRATCKESLTSLRGELKRSASGGMRRLILYNVNADQTGRLEVFRGPKNAITSGFRLPASGFRLPTCSMKHALLGLKM